MSFPASIQAGCDCTAVKEWRILSPPPFHAAVRVEWRRTEVLTFNTDLSTDNGSHDLCSTGTAATTAEAAAADAHLG